MNNLLFIAPNGFYRAPAGIYDGPEALYEKYVEAFPETPLDTLAKFIQHICGIPGWNRMKQDNPGLRWDVVVNFP